MGSIAQGEVAEAKGERVCEGVCNSECSRWVREADYVRVGE